MTTYAEYVETTHMFDYETMTREAWDTLMTRSLTTLYSRLNGRVYTQDSSSVYYTRSYVTAADWTGKS